MFETIARSKPSNLLKRDDLPLLTGPIKTTFLETLSLDLWWHLDTKDSKFETRQAKESLSFSSRKTSSSSLKSISPSTRNLKLLISSEKTPSSEESLPDKAAADIYASSFVDALIRSKTDSASFRESLSFKKALLVNSPGPASSKPTLLKALIISLITARPPCAYISTQSSPV